jgi:pimeloyl-ACP methyl ester carboxylesterase
MAMATGSNHQIIRDDAAYEITASRSRARRLIIAFTGVGFALGGLQTREFARSLRPQVGSSDVCHVIDRTRSWYNSDTESVAEALRSVAADYEDVVTLGNSMGGFGAVYFAGLIPNCVRAIAFCPQFSVMPGVIAPPTTRHEQFLESISEWRARTAVDHAQESVTYFVFYGSSDGIDARHAKRFAADGPRSMQIVHLPMTGHRIAALLRNQVDLSQLLDQLLNADAGDSAWLALLPPGSRQVRARAGRASLRRRVRRIGAWRSRAR